MEKINIALSAIEDNAAAIRELNKKLIKRTASRVVIGVPGKNGMSFGQVTSDGNVAVIVSYSVTGAIPLYFCDEEIIESTPPLFAVLPVGTGELRLKTNPRFAYAMILGGG